MAEPTETTETTPPARSSSTGPAPRWPTRPRSCCGGWSAGRTPVLRDGQLEAVAALVEDGARVLVVQRTGWGKSAVYFLATALLRARGAGPTLIVSPLLALMRDQVDAARRAGLRAVTVNSANADEWSEVSAALAADEVDLLLVSPERLTNPRFRDEQLPAAGRGHRPAGRRRGALHQRLGPRLPARLPADPRPADDPARRPAGACDDGDRQPAGGRRRGRAARRRRGARAYGARLARPRQPAARRARPAHRRRPAGLAGRPARRAARQRHRLRPDRRGRRGHRGAAAGGRPRRAGLHRAHRPGRPARPRAGAARQRGQGARRDQRAGHGLRQARPRLRRPPRRAGLAGRLLPAGRPGGPRHRARRRAAAAGDRGPRHLGLLRDRVDAAPARRRRRARGAGRRRPARCRRPRSRRSPTCGGPGWSCCSRCSTSTGAVVAGERRLGRRPATGWTYDEERYARVVRRADRRGRGDARLPAHDRLPDALPAGAARRPGGRRLRALRRLRRALGRPDRPRRARSRPRSAPCAGSGCRSSRRSQWPSGMARLGVDLRGRIGAERAGRGGPRGRPAHRPRLGTAAARGADPRRRRRRAGRRRAARGLRRGPGRLGLGRSARPPWSRCPPCGGRSWWPPWPPGSPTWAGCPTSGRSA